MPEWLIVLIVFIVFSRVLRARGYDARCMRGGEHRLRGRGQRLRLAERHALEREQRAMPAPKVETPMEALQRRYVEGEITVEEYEAGLDKLYRGGASA